MAARGVPHRDVPECLGQAQRHGCLWRAECVSATLSRPPDRRYGPRRGNGPVKPQSDRDGAIARDMDQVPKSEAKAPQRRS